MTGGIKPVRPLRIRALLPELNPAAYSAFVALMEHAIACGCGPRRESITSTQQVFIVRRQRECERFDELEREYREALR